MGLVAAAFVVVIGWMLWVSATSLGAWQRQHLHWNYAVQTIFFLIPLAVLASRQRLARDYGLHLTRPWLHVWLAILFTAVLVLVPLGVAWLRGGVGLNRAFVAYPVSTVVFHFVFSSFGEELFFRGFAQGELNRGLGRPWRVGAVRFGPGLVITAVLFAAGHLLGRGQSADAGSAATVLLFTGSFAVFAGLLREYTGGILAPTMLHATIDLNAHFFSRPGTAGPTDAVCMGVVYFILGTLLFAKQVAAGDGRGVAENTDVAAERYGRDGSG